MTLRVGVFDYGAGNLHSLLKAIETSGASTRRARVTGGASTPTEAGLRRIWTRSRGRPSARGAARALASGGGSAALLAGILHDGVTTAAEIKCLLAERGLPLR